MSAKCRLHLVAVAALLLTAGLGLCLAPVKPNAPAPAPEYRLSGAHTHDNLTIFLLHGADAIKGKKILTLDEALAAKKVVVHETKNVNQLSIENVSDQEVFVQAGDIVKGGQQDRTLAQDMLVAPKSGKLPVASFCVEAGRWAGRGAESPTAFSRSPYNLVGNDLKLACRRSLSQAKVWNEVNKTQVKLGKAVKAEVKDARSMSSLQLTLENKKVQESVAAAIKALEPSLDAKMTDVVGYAVVINGKVVGADAYANADLFRRLWPKLLRASVIEAAGEKKAGLKVEPVKGELVKTFLVEASKGKQTEKKLPRDMLEVQRASARNVFFETRQKDQAVLHRSYLAR